MSWKTAVYHYVHAKNQAELLGSAEPISPYMKDDGYLQIQQRRLEQMSGSCKTRGAQALRSETKLRFTRVKTTEHGVIAEIEMRRQLHYQIGTATYTEERIEPERLLLDTYEGKWLVRSAEALGRERGTSIKHGAFPTIAEAGDQPQRSPSLPFLNHSILNSTESLSRKIRYDREKAVAYAETWWNRSNPRFMEFEVDCTNYVSQCLFAGGAPMDYTGKRDSGWWFSGKQGSQELWSFSWAVAHSLQSFVTRSRRGLHGVEVTEPWELQPGDMISYDWDGDGRFQHNAIVTARDVNGMPLVNAHTYNSRNRYWDYRDSPAWTERTRYVFVRIADDM
ncbi:amidase domain-containing protein [Paenibacillus hexagrammi]|uniref:Amidase domain-containing protein n=1 Tax=Paenibacillus hexagrammi TaxID=2908839 RepID=A0ABY3SI49_9BACL|nr:amidase domain-containing protein [Paenibacillus sp. YPD9-1]UJF32800.1 amidase domain-containing protein [Paenibacillus sp. YPD9-1]